MTKLLNKIIGRILFVSVIILLLTACGRPKGVLSTSEMADVLADLHKLDGSMAAKGYAYRQFDEKDDYYLSVLQKHDITQAEFDSSLVWYSKNPKKLERIYDNVIIQLTDLETDIKKGKYHFVDSVNTDKNKIKVNIWNKKVKYVMTKDSTRSKLDFSIPDQGFILDDVYILKFIQRIAPEDSCKNQQIRFQINYANGQVYGVIKKVYNDGLTRHYTFRLKATKPLKIKSLSGQLLGSSAYKGKFNATIDSISLTRAFNTARRDSIMKVLQKGDPEHYPVMKFPIRNEFSQPEIRNKRLLILKK